MTRNKEAQAAMSARKLFYLGPQGTFTHQAAVNAAQELARLEPQGFDLMPMDDVPQILDAAQHGDGWGIVAWENNVEGYVVPNLDALIDAKDLVGFARVGVNVEFDAYVAQGADPAEARIATAHPHGLAHANDSSPNIGSPHSRPHPTRRPAGTLSQVKSPSVPPSAANCTTSPASAPPSRITKEPPPTSSCSRHAPKSHGCSPNHAPKLTSNTNRY